MADDNGEDADDERALELSTVAAIYPELSLDSSGSEPFSASIDVAVEPIKGLLIRFPTPEGPPPENEYTPPSSTEEGVSVQQFVGEGFESDANINENTMRDAHRLSHLPPLTLRLSLPNGYPAEKPPVFDLSSQWLPERKLQELRAAGHTIWDDMGRDQVVFAYIDHLREAAERGFDLGQGEAEVLVVSADLKVALLDFDLKAKRAKFERETFECGICLEPKKGTACHRLLLCSHVFCVECLQDFYNNCITEGDIGNVKCIAPKCGFSPTSSVVDSSKKLDDDGTLEPSELLQIPLEQEIVQRYVKLKRKKRLDSDPTTVYCPRQWCQGPARIPNKKPAIVGPEQGELTEKVKESDTDIYRKSNSEALPPPAERLAICEDCGFAFCRVCRASWHGEYFVCFPRSQFELTTEERASEDYMMLHTQPCPTCNARAQKTHGCNHMICFRCNTHFCYLCGAYLERDNPYQHYNTQQKGCYMRLWELEGGDDGEFGQGFQGGGAAGEPVEWSDDESDDDDELPFPPLPLELAVPQQNLPQAPAQQVQAVVVRLPGPAAPAAPRQDRQQAAAQRVPRANVPRRNDNPGLQRALRMIQDDEEDEWNSDEMDDLDDWE